MATTAARRRFLVARASIAKREAANDAAVFAVPPSGQFRIRIASVPGTSLADGKNGGLMIHSAQLFLADGSEIDGATVSVADDIASDVRTHLGFETEDATGDAIATDNGYQLLTFDEPAVRRAA